MKTIDVIINGIVKVTLNPSDFKVCNIRQNAPVSLMEFIETLENALGKKAEKNFMPMPMPDGDVVSAYADVRGFIEEFGYNLILS